MPSPFGPMTLGELIEALESTYKVPLPDYFNSTPEKERQIYYDWCDLRPSATLHSYRGYYDHLAAGIEADRSIYVAEFLKGCREAMGHTFTGYKGGEYTMDAKTPVWVADYSKCPGFGIVGVTCDGYSVTLKTERFKD